MHPHNLHVAGSDRGGQRSVIDRAAVLEQQAQTVVAAVNAAKYTLGHADLNVTADTYTSVLVELERATAEAAAGLIPRNNHTTGTDNPADEHDSH